MKRFTKSGLKSGDRVETRSGVRYIILKDSRSEVMLFSNGCYNSAKFNNDLLSTYSEQDIMKVFTPLKVADTLDLNAEGGGLFGNVLRIQKCLIILRCWMNKLRR